MRESLRLGLALGLALILWHLLAAILLPWASPSSHNVFPTPLDVAASLAGLLRRGLLWDHVGASLTRVAMGYAVAVALALPLGLAMGRWRALADHLGPLMEMLRPVPPFAWIPLALLWFGLGAKEQVFVIAVGAFFPILVHGQAGASGVDKGLIRAARSLGAGTMALMGRVVLPAALPEILVGLRVGLGFAWACVVAAEMVGSTEGLGFLILDSRNLGLPNLAAAGMAIIGVIGFTLDRAIQAISRRVAPWSAS